MTVVPFQSQPPASVGRSLVASMEDVFAIAETVANTEFVPKGLRGNQPAIIAAILYGREIGLEPMQSLSKIAVIDGRPTLSSEGQRALIFAAGHELWIEESTTNRATVAGIRRGDKTTTRVTWTLDDAKRAGIGGRRNWQTYPRQMLVARASAELARAIFADVIGGLAATEELDAEATPSEPEPTTETAAEKPATTTRRRRRATAPPPESDTPEPESVPTPDAVSPGQLRAIMGNFRELGLADDDKREARLSFASGAVGRPLTSSKDLTTVEADVLLDALKRAREEAVEGAVVETFGATEVKPSAYQPPADVQAQLEERGEIDGPGDLPPGY